MEYKTERRTFIKKAALTSAAVFSGTLSKVTLGSTGTRGAHRVFTSFSEPVVDPSNELFITWISNNPDRRVMEIRPAGSARSWTEQTAFRSREFPALPGHWLHTIKVSGLSPDTIYEYRVPGANFSDKVKTCPARLPLKVVWGSDWQMNDYSSDGFLWRLGDALTGHDDMDLLWLGGDYVNDDGRINPTYSQRWLNFLTILTARYRTREGAQYPMLALIGNHEGRSSSRLDDDRNSGSAGAGGDGKLGQIADIFTWSYDPAHPTRFRNSTGTMRIGNELFFLGLETDHTEPILGQFNYYRHMLAQNAPQVRHSFIGGHVPPFNNWSRNYTRDGDRALRNFFWPEAEKYSGPGKSMRGWLGGHTHALVVTPKLKIDYREDLSAEENDNRWYAHPEGFRQLGNGPMGVPARQNIDTINRISSIDGSHYWSAILKGDRRNPDPTYHEVMGEGVMNPQMPLAHAWVYELTPTNWTAKAVNLDGHLFYQFNEDIV